LQTNKENTNQNDPNRIAKVAEILGLMEESQKNKEWIFQHLKQKRIKNPAKRSMNSYQILNILSDKALEELHKTLTAKDVDELTDINSLTKTYHWFFTDIVAGSNPNIVTLEQARKIVVLNELIQRTETYKHHDKDSTVILPTGDGMVIGFGESPEYPLRLAIQLHKELNKYNKTRKGKEKLLLRIGIDTGPVYVVKDLTGKDNVWGPGIIMTRRVMDLGGDMNIFTSSRYAEDVRTLSPEYKEIMHPLDTEELLGKIPNFLKSDAERVFKDVDISGLPDWFKDTAQWWIEGKITDKEFITNVEYLQKTGVIRPR